MASRVYLMADAARTGKPLCVASRLLTPPGNLHPMDSANLAAWRRWHLSDARVFPWWLVEAESADAARAIITHDALKRTSIGGAFKKAPPVVKAPKGSGLVSVPVAGRILASGGQP